MVLLNVKFLHCLLVAKLTVLGWTFWTELQIYRTLTALASRFLVQHTLINKQYKVVPSFVNEMTNEDTLSAAAKHKLIEQASRAKNPLDTLPYDSYKSNTSEDEFKLYCRAKGDMDAKTLKWTFKLAEQNVGPFYKELKMGWKPKIKQAELNKNWARFLVAQNQQKQPVAYTMFRFDMDDGDAVLYWWI